MSMLSYRSAFRTGQAPPARTIAAVWRETRPNVARFVAELAADLVCAPGDAARASYGLTVQRGAWGRRHTYDARVAVHDARR